MKYTTPFLLSLIFISCSQTHNDHDHSSHANHVEELIHDHGFDAELAQELGADQFGMRKYVMAYLKAGPNRDQNESEIAALQKAHLNNIQEMADEGILVLAGPFLDEGPIRGIYIFDVESVEEARSLTNTDPMIQSGRLIMELHPWYGSAALKKVNAIHSSIQNTDISTH